MTQLKLNHAMSTTGGFRDPAVADVRPHALVS
jgi:hypothetical protein